MGKFKGSLGIIAIIVFSLAYFKIVDELISSFILVIAAGLVLIFATGFKNTGISVWGLIGSTLLIIGAFQGSGVHIVFEIIFYLGLIIASINSIIVFFRSKHPQYYSPQHPR